MPCSGRDRRPSGCRGTLSPCCNRPETLFTSAWRHFGNARSSLPLASSKYRRFLSNRFQRLRSGRDRAFSHRSVRGPSHASPRSIRSPAGGAGATGRPRAGYERPGNCQVRRPRRDGLSRCRSSPLPSRPCYRRGRSGSGRRRLRAARLCRRRSRRRHRRRAWYRCRGRIPPRDRHRLARRPCAWRPVSSTPYRPARGSPSVPSTPARRRRRGPGD